MNRSKRRRLAKMVARDERTPPQVRRDRALEASLTGIGRPNRETRRGHVRPNRGSRP